MEIRSITVGMNVDQPLNSGAFGEAGEAARDLKAALEGHGYPVQTLRLATQPLSTLMGRSPAAEAPGLASAIEAEAARAGFDYCSLGPVLSAGPGPASPLVQQVPEILAGTQRIFLSVMAATTRDGVSLAAIRETAGALARASAGDEEGTRVRRFTLSANVPPNGPFFPSAYHAGPRAGFSIALEAADLAVDAFEGAQSLAAAEAALTRSLMGHGARIRRLAEAMAGKHGLTFFGMDISLAPYPEAGKSIAGAMERLGVGQFGTSGTLFAAGFITSILSRTNLPKCGFSGLMIPLLEDSVMAQRYAEGAYTLDSLLLYSAVCGAGLDTIPIPGDSTVEQIGSVYLDLCALSLALDKPLTIRLMPLAGKKAGDRVTFAFPYFAPTRVVELRGPGSGGLLHMAGWVRGVGRPYQSPGTETAFP